MAAMNADMEMYKTGITVVQCICAAHDLQLRVVNKVLMLRITHFRPESLAFYNSLTNKKENSERARRLIVIRAALCCLVYYCWPRAATSARRSN